MLVKVKFLYPEWRGVLYIFPTGQSAGRRFWLILVLYSAPLSQDERAFYLSQEINL